MKNKDSFITQAMLSSFLTIEQKDYLSLLQPFVLKCLPANIGEIINIHAIQDTLNNVYHLDILYNVVEVLLQRCCRKENGAYIKKEASGYKLNKVYNSEKFDREKSKIKLAIENVINSLYDYLVKEKKLEKLTKEEAQNYLSVFLDFYNYSIYEKPETVGFITLQDDDNDVKTNYYVAQFILKEYEKESVVFDAILELIKGTLVAKSIYYFMYQSNDLSQKRILSTSFYLDTSLLIDVLDLNFEFDNQAVLELLRIIKENGGKLKTFSYYVEELQGIIYKYIKSPESRLSLSLDKFNRDKVSVIDAKAFMGTIKSRLEEMDILIEEKPDYSNSIKNQSWHIDYMQVKKELSSYIDYKNACYSNALTNDTDTIETIAYLRGNIKECSIFNCTAIFVTKNTAIVKVIRKLFFEEYIKKGKINLAISDIDLTAMIWLSTFGKQNDLPKLKLLENAYAACAPSKKLLTTFINKISKLEESEKISQETALLLRTQHNSLEDLVELTSNNEDNINDKIIREMEARLKNRTEKEIKIKLNEELQKIEEERALANREREDIEEARNNLISIQTRVIKTKQDNEHIIKRQNIQRQKIEEDKKYIFEQKKNLQEIRENIIHNVVDEALAKQHIYKKLFYTISFLISILIVIIFSYATYRISNFNDINTLWAVIITGIVGIISTISLIVSFYKFILKKINLLCERIYDKEYNKLIKKYKAITSIDDR